MTVNMLTSFRIGYFLDRVFEGEGYMPDSLGDLALGYYMSKADIDLTESNIMLLRFILANWQVLVVDADGLTGTDTRL